MYRFLLALLLSSSTLLAQQQTSVDAVTFAKGIQQPGIQVFDVRTAGEFNTGHLPDALQADYTKKTEFNERVQYLNKTKPVYVYCLSGGRSSAAARWMRENGFQQVVELEGGINAWKQAGEPLTGVSEKKPQMSVATYEKAIQQKGWVLTDVGATWCPPCRQMEPVLEKFLRENKQVTLVKVDGGNDVELMKAIDAKGLPTFILYKDGKEVWRKQGVVELRVLTEALQR
ncbi:rhodanese-like domain-containing protein [Chitinophaga nivalis]|uniref:Thioredoxin domain-containing protein n=1 Tax=Chitinophaga nivalis TaxID=2991709 RepID=A0ABT3ISJ1_9BACT|nr:rhodanese-like domain-containing protein [Chitinophaga nivalis]MCW3463369.1 thioredoxin domain-containing protein [Chitinophaga nivalis]MCW3486941.1 thioredoxin domain-containing protein [Chitinophaga nivalis]